MGHCLSKCIVSDISTELEAELDESRDYFPTKDKAPHGHGHGHGHGHNHGHGLAALSNATAPGTTASFGTTSLLAADEVVCLDVIGEGPSGVIYKGTYRGSVVAVKKMKMLTLPSQAAARENMENALEVEASRMGSLRHPNTVLFMGACLQGAYFCIVSEFCARGSLYNVLHPSSSADAVGHSVDAAGHSPDAAAAAATATVGGLGGPHARPHSRSNAAPGHPRPKRAFPSGADGGRRRMPPKWSLRIRVALGAARGLLYLHSAEPPLVHGQLKSTNILVDDSWNAKLADFGTRHVAEAVGLDRRRLANVDPETGLLRWTAPELLQLGEERALTGQFQSGAGSSGASGAGANGVVTVPEAVDVYSFGVVLWELTTGELPFAALRTNAELRAHVLRGGRPALTPGLCSLKWAELVARCWALEPARRPTAAEIVATLEVINKEESLAQAEKRKVRVVNSSRADYRFADKKHSKAKNSKFRSNVRIPE